MFKQSIVPDRALASYLRRAAHDLPLIAKNTKSTLCGEARGFRLQEKVVSACGHQSIKIIAHLDLARQISSIDDLKEES